jgi:hypothetical protein
LIRLVQAKLSGRPSFRLRDFVLARFMLPDWHYQPEI